MALAEDPLEAEPARAPPDPAMLTDIDPGHAPRCVLLVEDNMIIALDTEEHLLSLGVVTVNLATRCDAALASLDATTPDFAVLDFNLGDETSEPVARSLDGRGVPFAFATGFANIAGMTSKYPHAVAVLQKPYSRNDLARILNQPISD